MTNMKVDIVTEHLEFITETLPDYKSLNDNLLKESEQFMWLGAGRHRNADGSRTNVNALRTPNNICSPHLEIVERLVEELVSLYFAEADPQGTNDLVGGFRVVESWMNNYSKGDFTIPHDHLGCWYSYLYFVKTPKGSSPLVFTSSGKKIKAEEGKLVIFPCNVLHHVPKNKCEGRVAIAGNISHVNDKADSLKTLYRRNAQVSR